MSLLSLETEIEISWKRKRNYTSTTELDRLISGNEVKAMKKKASAPTVGRSVPYLCGMFSIF